MKNVSKLTYLLLVVLTCTYTFSNSVENELAWRELLKYPIKTDKNTFVNFMANTSEIRHSLQLVYHDDPKVYYISSLEPKGDNNSKNFIAERQWYMDKLSSMHAIIDSEGWPYIVCIWKTLLGRGLTSITTSNGIVWEFPVHYESPSPYCNIATLFISAANEVEGILVKIENGEKYYCYCEYNFTTNKEVTVIDNESISWGGRSICNILSEKATNGTNYNYVSTFDGSKYRFGKYDVTWTPCSGFQPITISFSLNDSYADRSYSKFKIKKGKIVPIVVWTDWKACKIYAKLGENIDAELVGEYVSAWRQDLSIDILMSDTQNSPPIPFIAYLSGINLKCAYKNPNDGIWYTSVVAENISRVAIATVAYKNRVYIAYYSDNNIVISYAEVPPNLLK